MANEVWLINPETKDLEFDSDGILTTIEDAEAAAQGVRQTLGAWKGDFELVPDHGTDYEKILGEPLDEELADEVIREAIFQEESVSSVEELTVEKSAGRGLNIEFSGLLSNGEKVSMEVTEIE